MSSSRSVSMRTCPRSPGAGASRARGALLFSLAALMLGGCSTTAASPSGHLFGGLIAGIAEPERKPLPPIDVEGDGREAQRPPPLRMYQREDDPTQPFSPNYGEVPLPQQTGPSEDAAPA